MYFNSYEVWITDSAGNRLPEYALDLSKLRRTATCYIPSESEETFIVHCRDLGGAGDHYFRFTVVLDSRWAGGSVCRPGQEQKRIGMRTVSSYSIEAYQFADVQTTEQDATVPRSPIIDKLGTIEVLIDLVTRRSCTPVHFKPQHFEEIGDIDERSMRAGTHCATLAPSKRADEEFNGLCKAEPLNPNAKLPQVTFKFVYRPAAILQAQGIIPLAEDLPKPQVNRSGQQKRRKSQSQGNPPKQEDLQTFATPAQGDAQTQDIVRPVPSKKSKKSKKGRRRAMATAARALTDVSNFPVHVKREVGSTAAGWTPVPPLAQTSSKTATEGTTRIKREENYAPVSPPRKRVRVKSELEDS